MAYALTEAIMRDAHEPAEQLDPLAARLYADPILHALGSLRR